MSKSLVSIIIPCYNAEQYVGEAIQSALDQTYVNREVIVIDDGSTDGSLEIIKSFGERIRWETGRNRGGCTARNRGLELARGEWIQFLDADDLISPEKLQKQLMVNENANTKDVLISCAWKRFSSSPTDSAFPEEMHTMPAQPNEWLIEKYMGRGTMPLHGWLTPKVLIERVGLWDVNLTKDQDGEFFDRVASLASVIVHHPQVMAYYRSGLADSVSSKTNRKALESCWMSITRGTERLLLSDSSERARGACAVAFMQLAIECWPDFPDLSIRAEERANLLGGAAAACRGGWVFLLIKHIFGWRKARQFQALWRSLK